jgi:uncharacterized phage protein gp47/JayE
MNRARMKRVEQPSFPREVVGSVPVGARTVRHAEGWAEHDVGSGAVKVEVAFPDAATASMRFTATLARHPEDCKIAQGHVSVGVAPAQVVGKELTI